MSGIGRHVEYAQNYVAQLTAQQAAFHQLHI